jgi:hypothetical protein
VESGGCEGFFGMSRRRRKTISCIVFCFKKKTAYEIRIRDVSSAACSSDQDAAGSLEVRAQVLLENDERMDSDYTRRVVFFCCLG